MSIEDAIRPLRVSDAVETRRATVRNLSRYPHLYHVTEEFGSEYDDQGSTRRVVSDPAEANIFSSRLPNDEGHTVALDVDFPVRAVPSSTEGHFHLYIDKILPWSDYVKLMEVMAEVGLLEPGYVEVSKKRGATHLRMPWERKAS